MRSRRGPASALALGAVGLLVVACSGTGATESSRGSDSSRGSGSPAGSASASSAASSPTTGTATTGTPAGPTTPASTSAPSVVAGQFTMNFAGDVNFAERTATRLAAGPATAFGVAAGPLAAADLTMVNLETAIAVGGAPERKSFTFQAPPTALTALRDAGVDVATMANNHAADYGAAGLQQTLAAIRSTRFPVVGIGTDETAAYAPWTTTVRGTRIAVLAATQVQDETLAHFTAGPDSAGVASAYSERLVESVRSARAAGYVVVVYVHWGTEYTQCPNSDQTALAATLAQAGAAAVIGTHAHVLQGAGWRTDGTYVAYGLSNYLWWRSFDNDQDDNGILTLTFTHGRVTAARFAPAHLDDTGVPVPATGATRTRIDAEWASVRGCADLAPDP